MKRKIKKIQTMIKQFGVIFVFKFYYYRFMKRDENYIDLSYYYLKKIVEPLIDKFNNLEYDNVSKVQNEIIPVWLCWFQGEISMPEVCNLCYSNLKKMLPDNAKVKVITIDNYKNYVDIPEYILEKVDKGIISYTHLSDIIRWGLLSKWGGVWIDATVFSAKKITPEFMADKRLWSIKLENIYDINCIGQAISTCKWTSFMIKDQDNSLLSNYMFEAKLLYWKNHDVIIEYFMQNLLIKIAYDNVEKIRYQIDNIKINNKNVYELHNIINDEFNQYKYNNLIKETTFFKLTWKQKYNKITDNNIETFYGYISSINQEV
ncbi:capsular polysaccharide synthesis protein [Clostridium butyricum]|uniref:Putative glycosyl transferase n=1 Tax=Clostridium butyricum E4 str. BoNT E BL5262 TaxID=632245 RepID=C4IDA9_CLOBU|nr:capsular polysaccharide synthesis protein [Clostridium butyricum]APF21870.1 capsular polysaccharide synthesis family protein [Clostridium butyricum]EDT76660.1 putative glycosyl transferase [Clostridium butyricum 5521]EEP55911.1 putative glycosyl transferase [Clostridium butyricum E4 str. BoNT E BL5262]NFL31848.1 glycosyl transferase [Clostridium butyricum]NFS19769.1 glycosyl transferase [Clostridium butyricum]